jgi:uncharacterized protein (DUF1501 family)
MSKFSRRSLMRSGAALGAGAALFPRIALAADDPNATFLIEICLRDQLDFGHVMVAPGLAKDGNLRRGENGRKAALFFSGNELTALPNDVFLTPQSLALKPHLDTVALVELCELTKGPIHGHEASNPIRSPGRGDAAGPGRRLAMWEGEPGQNNAEGASFSSTPTPVALHNAIQKQLTPGLRNAVVIKGTERAGGIYHFGAGLAGAEPDRFQDVDGLMRAFPTTVSSKSILPPAEAAFLERGLKSFDQALWKRRAAAAQVVNNHLAQLAEAKGTLGKVTTSRLDLKLTPQEKLFWSANTPGKYGRITIEAWEQAAYAFKLVSSGQLRSVAIEIDIGDVHGERTEPQMKQQTAMTVGPLVALIEKLKEAQMYDRSLIVVSTSDGGRAPAAGSSGDEGKNGFILAGGMVRGGYYGDIKADSPDGEGHKYRYFAPDIDTGKPDAQGSLGNDRRLPAANLWRTIMHALRVPSATLNEFPSVASAKVLNWLVR